MSEAHSRPLVGRRLMDDSVRSWRTSPARAWVQPLVEWARAWPEEKIRPCPHPGEDVRRLVKACGGDWEWARRALAAAGGDLARARVMVERRRPQEGEDGGR